MQISPSFPQSRLFSGTGVAGGEIDPRIWVLSVLGHIPAFVSSFVVRAIVALVYILHVLDSDMKN